MSTTTLIQLMATNHKTELRPFSNCHLLADDEHYFSWRRELSLTLSCYDLKKYINAKAVQDNAAIKHINHEKHKPTRSASLLEVLTASEAERTGMQAHMLAEISFMKEMDAWLAIDKIRANEAAGMTAAKKLLSEMITPEYRASIDDFDALHAHEIIKLLDERCQLKAKAKEALPKLMALKSDVADNVLDYIIIGLECFLLAKEHDASLEQAVLHRALLAGLPAAYSEHVVADGEEAVSLSFDLFMRRLFRWGRSIHSELGLEPVHSGSDAAGTAKD